MPYTKSPASSPLPVLALFNCERALANRQIWQYIDSYKTSDTVDIPLPNGLGAIVLRLDWSVGTPGAGKLGRKRSMSSIAAPSPAFASANGVNADGASVHAGSPGRLTALRKSIGRKHATEE